MLLWSWLKSVIVGVGHDPKVVARARALLLYVIPLLIGAAISYVNGWALNDPGLAVGAGLLIAAIRAFGEGLLDQVKRPTQNDVIPMPPAGAGEADGSAIVTITKASANASRDYTTLS